MSLAVVFGYGTVSEGVDEDDVGTLLGGDDRVRATLSAASACDKDNLAVEKTHYSSLLRAVVPRSLDVGTAWMRLKAGPGSGDRR
jgi:hypothetical protein